MLELLAFVVSIAVLPVLVNKSTEGRFEWVKRHLRSLWTATLTFFTVYFLNKQGVLEVTMQVQHRIEQHPSIGYAIAATSGAILLCGYWWLAGRIFVPHLPPPASPTAAEIAAEVARHLPPLNQTGNLKPRTLSLAHEIIEDLCMSGWNSQTCRQERAQMGEAQRHSAEEAVKVAGKVGGRAFENLPGRFMFRFYKRTVDARDELAALNLRDRRMDDFIDYRQRAQQARQVIEANRAKLGDKLPAALAASEDRFSPHDAEEVVLALRDLAGQLP
jgi:hypothetical protein